MDMANLQLSNLNYGSVPIYTTTQMRIDNIGRYADLFGSYTYPEGSTGNGGGMADPYDYGYDYGGGSGGAASSYYYPSGGSVNRIVEVGPSGSTIEVTGLSASAPALFNMAQARDAAGILNLVFGGDDVINGSSGNDWIDGFGGNDNVTGGAGADSVRGLDGADLIDGGAGNDDVNGNQGTDTVRGGDGADIVRGGQGADTISGDGGDDVHVNGNIGDDQVSGGAGNDAVFGGQDQDRLFGDDGADTLSGDLGNDTLTGGSGADRFVIRAGGGADVVTDFNFAEGDRIQLVTGQAFTLSAGGGGSVLDLGAGTTITLSGVAPGNASDWVVFA
jgi:Ca2+-binding RTX toxin-like protein